MQLNLIKSPFFLLSILVLIGFKVNAQKPEQKTTAMSKHLVVYADAFRSGDYPTAITALSYYVAENPDKANYKDSLAFLYYLSSNYHQCIYWCDVLIKKELGNTRLMEIKAASLKLTGQFTEAVHEYEQLLKHDPNPVYAYNLMELQYQLKRYYECAQTSSLIEVMKYKEQMLVTYRTEDNQMLQTPIKSAMYHLLGLTCMDIGRLDESKQALDKALQMDTGSVLVKVTLKKLEDLQKVKEKEDSREQEIKPKGELKKD